MTPAFGCALGREEANGPEILLHAGHHEDTQRSQQDAKHGKAQHEQRAGRSLGACWYRLTEEIGTRLSARPG